MASGARAGSPAGTSGRSSDMKRPAPATSANRAAGQRLVRLTARDPGDRSEHLGRVWKTRLFQGLACERTRGKQTLPVHWTVSDEVRRSEEFRAAEHSHLSSRVLRGAERFHSARRLRPVGTLTLAGGGLRLLGGTRDSYSCRPADLARVWSTVESRRTSRCKSLLTADRNPASTQARDAESPGRCSPGPSVAEGRSRGFVPEHLWR